MSDKWTGHQIAGPKAREVLQACTREDVSDMKFLDVRRMTLGLLDVVVQRVSYTGDLGYEIYCDPLETRTLWDQLWAAGQPHGMKPFGMRAMMSLRLDRHFGSWLREFSPDYTPAETGLDRFIAWKKNADFIGRAAAEKARATGPGRQLCMFEIDTDVADVKGYEPLWLEGEVVGYCTSGGYSHHLGKSMAHAFVPTERIAPGMEAEIEVLGVMCKARRIDAPLFDADGARMRG